MCAYHSFSVYLIAFCLKSDIETIQTYIAQRFNTKQHTAQYPTTKQEELHISCILRILRFASNSVYKQSGVHVFDVCCMAALLRSWIDTRQPIQACACTDKDYAPLQCVWQLTDHSCSTHTLIKFMDGVHVLVAYSKIHARDNANCLSNTTTSSFSPVLSVALWVSFEFSKQARNKN